MSILLSTQMFVSELNEHALAWNLQLYGQLNTANIVIILISAYKFLHAPLPEYPLSGSYEHNECSNLDGSRSFARYRKIDNEMKRELVKLIDWPIASSPKMRFKNVYSIKTLEFRRKRYTFADEQEPKI